MSAHNDGGAAFPTAGFASGEDIVHSWGEDGMTLRDFFAAKALPAVLEGMQLAGQEMPWVDIARIAYAIADAMLAAREVKP